MSVAIASAPEPLGGGGGGPSTGAPPHRRASMDIPPRAAKARLWRRTLRSEATLSKLWMAPEATRQTTRRPGPRRAEAAAEGESRMVPGQGRWRWARWRRRREDTEAGAAHRPHRRHRYSGVEARCDGGRRAWGASRKAGLGVRGRPPTLARTFTLERRARERAIDSLRRVVRPATVGETNSASAPSTSQVGGSGGGGGGAGALLRRGGHRAAAAVGGGGGASSASSSMASWP